MTAASGRLASAGPAILALALSAGGGAVAWGLGLPAPWLVGGAAAVTVAALLGAPIAMPAIVCNAGLVIVGMAMGSLVARDALALIGQWPVTMAALAVSLAVIVGATAWVLTRHFGFDRRTAILAATPGHASFIQGLALSGLGDAREVAVVHSIRILTMVIAVPVAIQFAAPEALHTALTAPAEMGWATLAWLSALCIGAGWAAQRLGVPAGFVIGAMIAATATRLGGMTEGAVPAIVVVPGFVVIAALIGSRFAGVTGDLLRRSLAAGLVATVLTVVVSALTAWTTSFLVGFSFGEVWIALAPGGLDAMAVLGLALGYDPAFVMTHHATRLFMLGLAVPVILAAMRPRSASPTDRRPTSGD